MSASHNDDGTLKDGAISASNLNTAAPGTGQHLAYDGTKLTWVAPPIDDPAVGGDLSGTASNAQIVAGAVGTSELADTAVTNAKLATGAVLQDNIGTSNAAGSGQVLSFDGRDLTWVTPASGGGDPTMGGDLSGTASNAQIAADAVGSAELATGAVLLDSIGSSNAAAANQLLSYDGSALIWVDPPSGGTAAAVIDCYTYTFGETIAATGTARMYVEYTSTVSKIRVSAGTAVAGQSVIVDINKNGITLYTTQANRPAIAVGASTQVAAAPDVTAFTAGDYITVDVDQLGNVSGSYGVPLTISIYLQRN